MPRKKKKSTEKDWRPPPGFFAAANPEEFKFCFALMNAASSGKMSVPTPRSLLIDGIGEVSLTNTPRNRGMLAVTKHLSETHPHDPEVGMPPESMALCNRILELGQLICRSLEGKEPRIEKYVSREGEIPAGAVEIAEPLVEAAATAPIGEGGFDVDRLIAIADQLLAAQDAKTF